MASFPLRVDGTGPALRSARRPEYIRPASYESTRHERDSVWFRKEWLIPRAEEMCSRFLMALARRPSASARVIAADRGTSVQAEEEAAFRRQTHSYLYS